MLKIVSPFDQSVIKEIPYSNESEIETALQIATNLFQNQSNWLPAYQRIEILEKVASIMTSRQEELTIIASKEGGKPYRDSKAEISRAINGVKIATQCIGQLKGEQIPMGLTKASENRVAFTTREPIGVVFAISAFNHPLNLIVHQTITAIAAGCPVIIKPALTTPLSCITLMDIIKEAGLPKGWCQLIICENNSAEKLVADSRISYFSFIGSSKVGWHLRSKLAPGTRCALEHGGAAPVIVEPDANFDELLPALSKGAFYHAGQVCVSVQRVFVHESIIDNVANQLADLSKTLKVGNPTKEDTEIGPLILPQEVERVETWVKEAIAEGATCLSGGHPISDTCYAPTVLVQPSLESKVSTLEIFGPVVCLYSYSDRSDAIALANDLDVHFQAAVFTKDIDNALDTANKLNATAVMINDHTAFRVDWMPFGGRDESGIGMGGISYTMQEMTREKLLVINSKNS